MVFLLQLLERVFLLHLGLRLVLLQEEFLNVFLEL